MSASPFNQESMRFLNYKEAGELLGFSARAMGQLVQLGAPSVGKRVNPLMVWSWISENADKVRGIKFE